MYRLVAVAALSCLVAACKPAGSAAQETSASEPRPAPMSIRDLRTQAFDTKLQFERRLDGGPGFSAYLVSYRHAGLKLHAMVAEPLSPMPEHGFPVLVALHGYVPDPRKYGITAQGLDARPGDYYRPVPSLYAARGYLVVMPDYRGHNSSEGFDFIREQDESAIAYYAEDVAALLASLDDLEHADADNIFIWSHSMGGAVAMRSLLATDLVKAASFWATASVEDLLDDLDELDCPVLLQHATGDRSTPYSGSTSLAAALARLGRPHAMVSYDSDEHFFTGAMREQAADRDEDFFRSYSSRTRSQ